LEDAAVQQSVVQIVNYETMVWQTPTENGTCHQVLLDWEGMYIIWSEGEGNPLGRREEEGERDEQYQVMLGTLELVHGLRTRRARRRLEGIAPLDQEQRQAVETLVREVLRRSYLGDVGRKLLSTMDRSRDECSP
jgi:hypothetical protein